LIDQNAKFMQFAQIVRLFFVFFYKYFGKPNYLLTIVRKCDIIWIQKHYTAFCGECQQDFDIFFWKGSESMQGADQKRRKNGEDFCNRAGIQRRFRRLGRPRCLLCGELIALEDGFYERDGFPYCKPCMEVIDTDLLIRICETDRKNWLESMGFSYMEH